MYHRITKVTGKSAGRTRTVDGNIRELCRRPGNSAYTSCKIGGNRIFYIIQNGKLGRPCLTADLSPASSLSPGSSDPGNVQMTMPRILHPVSRFVREINYRKTGRVIAPYLLLALLVLTISLSFGLIGGIDEYLLAFRYELPFLLLAFAALLYLMRPGLLRVLVAAAPIIAPLSRHGPVLYLHAQYLSNSMIFSCCPRVLSFPRLGCRWGSGWARTLGADLSFPYQASSAGTAGAARLAPGGRGGPPIVAFTAPTQFLKMADSRGVNIVPWSDRWTVALMGRATSLMLFAAAKHKAIGRIGPAADDRRPRSRSGTS